MGAARVTSKAPDIATGDSGHAASKPPAEAETLVFINRYSADASGKHVELDRSTIGKRVQHVIRKKKKHDASVTLNRRESTGKGFAWRLSETKSGVIATSESQASASIDRYAAEVKASGLSFRTSIKRPEVQLGTRTDGQSGPTKESYSSVHLGLPAHGPLWDTQLSATQSQAMVVAPALSFFMETHLPRVYPVPSQARAHKEWMMQRLATSPVLYFSAVAAGAAGIQALSGNSPWKAKVLSVDARSLELSALAHLRSSLAGTEDFDPYIMVSSVTFLVVVQILNGDIDAINAHASALSNFVRLYPAVRCLPMQVVENFITCYLSSMITGRPPIPPPLHHTEMTEAEARSVLTHIIDSHPHLADLGQMFNDSSVQAALGPTGTQLFLDMRSVVIWREYWYAQRFRRDDAEIVYFHNLSRTIRFLALNSLSASGLAPSPTKITTLSLSPTAAIDGRHLAREALHESFRIALLIFWNAYNQISRPGAFLYRTLATQLEQALKSSLNSFTPPTFQQLFRLTDKPVESLLLWILLLGALLTEGENNSTACFFEGGIAAYAQTFPSGNGRHDWTETRDSLKRALYLDRAFAQCMERCWTQALELLR